MLLRLIPKLILRGIEPMQRVRKFLIINEDSAIGNRLPTSSSLSSAIQREGWHQSWDTAIGLMETWGSTKGETGTEGEVAIAIADESVSLIVAIFSHRNLESLEPVGGETKWRSVKITSGDGYWCNLNYSDYGWGWVSGAKREVPFRLRFFERRAEANPDSVLARTRAWIMEARDWFYGHDKKIG